MTQPRTTARALPALRLEHLWVLLALSLVGVFISLSPTAPNDFWWHLKAGELVATGGIPTTNIFAWTVPAEAPFVYQSWLGEWSFYALYRLGGLPLVIFARNLLATGAFALVAVAAHQRSGSWRLAGGAALLAAAMTMNNFTTRPQNFSLPLFALLLLLLGSYADNRLAPRWLLALPLLMALWVNGHGAFVVGLLVMGAFVAGETARRLLRQPRALSWARLRWLYLAALGMLAATLLNPRGPAIYAYVGSILGDSAIQGLINEWQPPTPRSLAGMFFYLGVLALVAAGAFARRRPTVTDVLLACGTAWLAFNGARSVVWFGMAAMPFVAQCLAAPRAVFTAGGEAAPRLSLRERGGGGAANSAVALLLALAVVAVQPWFKAALPLPAEYGAIFAEVPGAPQLFSADTPVAATEHLRAEPCAGRLLNELGYGSYLIWAAPAQQVFIDPRIELFPLPLWQDYARLSREPTAAPSLIEKYGIACVMLDTGHQPGLAAAMPALPGWERTFREGRSEVWRK